MPPGMQQTLKPLLSLWKNCFVMGGLLCIKLGDLMSKAQICSFHPLVNLNELPLRVDPELFGLLVKNVVFDLGTYDTRFGNVLFGKWPHIPQASDFYMPPLFSSFGCQCHL